jgi:hypothetical protein
MGLRQWWRGRYPRMIRRGLSTAYHKPGAIEPAEIGDLKLVVFSDHHKGMRDDADDFWRCEAAYNAALGYYLEAGYRLVVLGDAEELWESRPEEVVGREPTYPRTLELEGSFAREGRYTRIWGNHDDDWAKDDAALRRALGIAGAGLSVRESLRLDLERGDGGTQRIFLVHGHQGTLESQLIAPVSKVFVRYGWSRIQRRIRRPWNTPARDHALRGRHNEAMADWASSQSEPVVLVAGHTHQPVFRGRDRRGPNIEELERRREELRASPTGDGDKIALMSARIEAERVLQDPKIATPDLAAVRMSAPFYFNTGCCSFGDGGITGIEIADEHIRLVRWPWPYGEQEASRQVLDQEPLEDVFAAVARARRSGA